MRAKELYGQMDYHVISDAMFPLGASIEKYLIFIQCTWFINKLSLGINVKISETDRNNTLVNMSCMNYEHVSWV